MCPDCEARRKLARDALFNAKIGDAVAHVAKGAAEAAGLKKKSGSAELKKKQAKKNPGVVPVTARVGQQPQE